MAAGHTGHASHLFDATWSLQQVKVKDYMPRAVCIPPPHWPQYRQPKPHGRAAHIQAMHASLMPHSVPAAGCMYVEDYCIMNCNVMK
jgi:hypothetical protein